MSVQLDFRAPAGYDRTRNAVIGNKDFELQHLEEAYTTEHWLVRIYKVKKPPNRLRIPPAERIVKRKKVFISKKVIWKHARSYLRKYLIWAFEKDDKWSVR